MTLVHGSTPGLRGPVDDGTGLQRRLMQDLERQWLDSWAVADQLQAPPGPSPEPTAQDRVQSQDPADAGSPLAATTPAAKAASMAGHAHAPRLTSGAAAASEGSGPQMLAPRPAKAALPPGQVPSSPAMASPAVATSGSLTTTQSPLPSQPNGLRSTEGIPWERPDTVQTPGDRPVSADAPRPPMPAMSVTGSSNGAIQTPASTGTPTALPLPVPRALPMAAAVPQVVTESLSEAPAPMRRAAPPTPAEIDPGPQHLMLRELGEHEVLASLRDAALGSAESHLAAQGLAHALMEAGYARVQVVVNGQQQRRDSRNGATVTSGASSLSSPSAPPHNLSSQESRHGR